MISPRVDRNTRVIVQGISGRAGRLHSRLMKEYGTNLVAGISSRKEVAEINGVPLFTDCASAVKATGATASVALVGAFDLLAAIEEALAAGIRYIVTPTEGMPVHDALKAKRAVDQAGAIWVGASTPGMAVAGEAGAASRYAGFSTGRMIWIGMLAGGSMAGIAGMGEVAGPMGQLTEHVSNNYGFAAIIVAFVGRLNAVGIFFASLLMALLYLGGEQAQQYMSLPSSISKVFQGMLLFFLLGTDLFVNYRLRYSSAKR